MDDIFSMLTIMGIRTRKNLGKAMQFKSISPHTVYNLMLSKKCAIVNTLDSSISISRGGSGQNNNLYGSKFITKPCSFLEKYYAIVLYCANDTCGASKTYAKKLSAKCSRIHTSILLYKGGSFEWALLALLYPEQYTFSYIGNGSTLTRPEIIQYLNKVNHRPESSKMPTYPKLVLDNVAERNLDAPPSANNTSCGLLHDKVCVVTGGTSGLGLEAVKEMLRNGAKHVTLTYWHNKERAKKVEAALAKTYGTCSFKVIRADCRTEAGNKLTFDKELRKKKLGIDVGPIDCVDVNAGIFGPANLHRKHIFNIPNKDYEDTMATNLRGYFFALKYFSKQAIENEVANASAVCIKSIYGSTGSLFSNIAYQTSKHGVLGLVHQSAIELARPNKLLKIKHPIRVNAVSPTFTDTALTKPFLDISLVDETLKNDNPTGKLALKSSVANAVIFLLSDKAKCITGTDLPVDCGVLAESIPTYSQVVKLNEAGIEDLSCCGDTL